MNPERPELPPGAMTGLLQAIRKRPAMASKTQPLCDILHIEQIAPKRVRILLACGHHIDRQAEPLTVTKFFCPTCPMVDAPSLRDAPPPRVNPPRKTGPTRPEDAKVHLRCLVPPEIRKALRHMALDLGVPTHVLVEQIVIAFVHKKNAQTKP